MATTLHANSTATVIIAVLFVILAVATVWLCIENQKLKKKYRQSDSIFRMTRKSKKQLDDVTKDDENLSSPLNQNQNVTIDLMDKSQK